MKGIRDKKLGTAILAAIFLLITVFAAAGAAKAYTYDSEYDPAYFQDWTGPQDPALVGQTPLGPVVSFFMVNPGLSGPDAVSMLAVVFANDRMQIIAYSYLIDGEPVLFVWDRDKQHYKLTPMCEESAKDMKERLIKYGAKRADHG